MKAHSSAFGQSSCFFLNRDSVLYKLISVLASWGLIMGTLPAYAADRGHAERAQSRAFAAPPVSDALPARDTLAADAAHLALPAHTVVANRLPGNVEIASLGIPALAGKRGSDFLANPFVPSLFSLAMQSLNSPFQISVGFADSTSASANFPTQRH